VVSLLLLPATMLAAIGLHARAQGTTGALYVVGAILMTILFTWLYNHPEGSVLYSLLFHASMNTASTRLPNVPAYPEWVLVLLAVVLVILVADRCLGWQRSGPSSSAARARSLG
jgi:hypothetical protein